MVFAIAGIAGLGFIVWGHHMFQSGMNPALGATFMLSTMMIALPSAIKVFNWLGTIWGGRLHFTTAMLNALAFVAMFIIGGLSGIFMAATPVDMHIHDTYFIVGHIHYVLFGGSTFGIFAAITFWFPKMFGRMMDERLGKIHFFLTFLFFNGTFFLMHIVGMHGHPRRIADPTVYEYLRGAGIVGMNQFMTISAFCLGLTQIIFAYNFFYSLFAGPKAPRQPVALEHARVDDDLAAAVLQLRADPHGLPRPVRVQRAGRGRRLPAADRAPPGRGRAARPGHGLSDAWTPNPPRSRRSPRPRPTAPRPTGRPCSRPSSPGRSCSRAGW